VAAGCTPAPAGLCIALTCRAAATIPPATAGRLMTGGGEGVTRGRGHS
jgi:hypothetical protein